MTQNEEFEFLRAIAAREQQDEREQPTGTEVDERHKHRQPPRKGAPTLPGSRPSTSGIPKRLTTEFVHPTPSGFEFLPLR
jgi:hypothetical protein